MKPFFLLIAFVLGGCARVTIFDGEGNTTVRYGFGVIKIEPAPEKAPVNIRINGAGLAKFNGMVAFGYHVFDITLIPQGYCQLMIWPRAHPDEWEKIIRNFDNVCKGDKPNE